MNKKEYLQWLKDRPKDPADWNLADAIAADELIKQTALKNFKQRLKVVPIPFRAYLYDCVKNHMGYGEVDSLLMELDCYPSWIEKGK